MSDERKSGFWDRIKKIATGEVFSYLFFGVCTTVVNIVVFQFCCSAIGLHARPNPLHFLTKRSLAKTCVRLHYFVTLHCQSERGLPPAPPKKEGSPETG